MNKEIVIFILTTGRIVEASPAIRITADDHRPARAGAPVTQFGRRLQGSAAMEPPPPGNGQQGATRAHGGGEAR